jgi:curved DNA-binding protein CbpA
MQSKYFEGCQTADQIKERYRKLALEHHPDRGGDTRTMQEINAEYAFVMRSATRAANPGKSAEEYASMDEVSEAIRQAIERIIRLDGITIEICGLWVWVSGDTYPVRETLKGAGYRFSRKKVSWYFAGVPTRSKQTHSMDYIRDHYGSQKIMRPDQQDQNYRVAA